MSIQSGSQVREVVDWGAGERRRRRLETELERIVRALADRFTGDYARIDAKSGGGQAA